MSQIYRTRGLLVILVLLLVTQSCNAVSTTTQQAPSATEPSPIATTEAPAQTQAPVEATPAPIKTEIPDPEDICPTPGEGTALYMSKENGFCLLYPTSFNPKPDEIRPNDVLILLGPRESDKPKTQEEISVLMSVAYNGPADGLDSTGYARKWHEYYGGPDAPFNEQQTAIAGQPAVMLKDLPGFAAQRSAFLIANGHKYQITLSPQPEDMPELAEAASLGWDTVTASIVFFPPQNQREVRRPEEVCPQESIDLRLYRDDTSGYCFLYPADFAPDPQFPPGMIKGGPVLGQWEGGDVRTYVAAGTFGNFAGQTPRQVLEPRMEYIDAASVQDATIGGYPAVTFRSFQGPWPSRQAIIVVDGDVYTLVGEPWDPQNYPDGIPYLDRLWEAITGSMAFFDPWR
jgi:hypothetical protein